MVLEKVMSSTIVTEKPGPSTKTTKEEFHALNTTVTPIKQMTSEQRISTSIVATSYVGTHSSIVTEGYHGPAG